MGKLIVIEGLDGSGKATQTELLCRRLTRENIKNHKITFPDYEHDSSVLVRMYLGGQLGQADEVGAYAASSFYAMDRYVSYRQRWGGLYNDGVLISDRYTTSNAVHQTSKLPPEQWDEYLDWLEDYEYNRLMLPRPDMVVFLSVPIEISRELIMERYDGKGEKKDIHEADEEYLQRCYKAAEYVTKRFGWQVVNCCPDGQLLSKENISNIVWQMTQSVLKGETK